MSELSLGETEDDKKKLKCFTVKCKDFCTHTFLTGQSGSGKTEILARIIEELILHGCGNILLFDFNYEFMHLKEVNNDAFNKRKTKWIKQNCAGNVRNEFNDEWNKLNNEFEILESKDLKIHYDDICEDFLMKLMDIDGKNHPGAAWLVDLIKKDRDFSEQIGNAESFKKLIDNFRRWSEGRTSKDEQSKVSQNLFNQIQRFADPLDFTRLRNGAEKVVNIANIEWGNTVDKKNSISEEFLSGLFDDKRLISLDMLGFRYDNRFVRDLIALQALNNIWKIARKRYIEASEKGKGEEITPPIFIVIDEAHNIVPGESADTLFAKEISEIIRTIAAEGRKFKIFLILISQRPDKIHRSVISECQNYIIMKSIPPTIEKLHDLLPSNLNSELERLINYKKGDALYYGKFTKYDHKKVSGDIRRTKK